MMSLHRLGKLAFVGIGTFAAIALAARRMKHSRAAVFFALGSLVVLPGCGGGGETASVSPNPPLPEPEPPAPDMRVVGYWHSNYFTNNLGTRQEGEIPHDWHYLIALYEDLTFTRTTTSSQRGFGFVTTTDSGVSRVRIAYFLRPWGKQLRGWRPLRCVGTSG